MSRLLRRVCASGLFAANLFAFSCDNTGTPSQPGENLLVPRQWMQLQSDEQGTGFNGVHTSYAVPSLRMWRADVGELAFSSPVIDMQGDVWVGNIDGELVEVAPNGAVKGRHYVGGSIVSSPAVDDHHRVYVLAQYPDGDSFRTILHCYDPALGFTALNNPPKYKSSASPKVWGDYIFVPSDRTLRVFNRFTLDLVAEATTCPTVVCGNSPILDVLGVFLKAVGECMFALATVDIFDLTDCSNGFSVRPSGAPLDPSVAIVDNATIVEDTNNPIVLMATSQCLTAFDFIPTDINKLQIRWQKEVVDIDCDFETVRLTTPAVLDGDQVVIADHNSVVRSYQVSNGNPLWSYTADFEGAHYAILAPPVAALRQIFVLTVNQLIVIDSDGDEVSKEPLAGNCYGASLSLDFVYAMTSEGIYSGSLNSDGALVLRTFDNTVTDGIHYGGTVPAIGMNGVVYLAVPDGFLYAYGPGQLTLATAAPAVSWIAPTEGASVYTSTGQTMRVALGGGQPFTGKVSINSDVDGSLCQFSVTDAMEGMCTTKKPLTVGQNVLTAYAIDPDGLQEIGQIAVNVIAAPIQ